MAAGTNELGVTRHDLSLFVIGGVLLAGLVVGLLPAVDLSRSLFTASVPAVAGMVYTLFYRPPTVEPGE
ncbi:MAG: hypothetical protein ACI8TL_000944 [Natronomonas sp.]|jgi:hypothetical protein